MKGLVDLHTVRLLFGNMRDAVMFTNQDLVIEYCNRSFEDFFGFSTEKIMGTSAQVLFLHKDWEMIVQGLSENEPISKSVKNLIHKDGQKVEAEVTVYNIRNEAGILYGCMIVFRVSEEVKNLTSKLAYTLKEMEFANREMLLVNNELEGEIRLRTLVEEELRQQKLKLEKLNADLENIVKKEVEANREKERMMVIQSRQASMGEILESVAHQWKQPLNTVNLLLYEIQELAKAQMPFAEIDAKIQDVYGVIRFMSDTINDFRSFFIPSREKKYFRMEDAIKQTVRFLEPEFRHAGIQVKMDLEEDAVLCGFQNELTQVLLNILNNARDAISAGRVSNPFVQIGLRKMNQCAVIRIGDNAGGIPEELLPEIFTAYVSTKSEGKGTGLGLYIAKTIVERNFSGKISCRNSEEGAVFMIEIPLEL